MRDEIEAAYRADREGRESDAVVHYDRAYALGVPNEERIAFLLGYGSTLRNVGRFVDSERVLREALALAPDDASLSAFLALTLGSRGRADASLARALDALLGSGDERIARYARSLGEYRDELDRRDATRKPRVVVRYCPKCRWLTRASWIAQELLVTFPDDITVELEPGPSGIFEVTLDGERIFSRETAQRFPEPKELKQAIRDRVAPERSLGHSD